jgi:hypothetical protein
MIDSSHHGHIVRHNANVAFGETIFEPFQCQPHCFQLQLVDMRLIVIRPHPVCDQISRVRAPSF